mgnify:CR=1 FL=1
MKVWFAGVPGGGSPGDCKRERELNLLWILRLWSYYHLRGTGEKMTKGKKVDLFLDSGAFSAFTQGIEINIQEYIEFIKEHEKHLEVYANLDVIGDPVGSYRNQKIMERAGLKPIPCFHYGEDPKWLLKYMDEGNDYIALGGMAADKSGAALTSEKRQAWLDQVFSNFICGPNGLPKVKIHGFGLTSLRLMMRYPWYSVDSTSWVVTGRMGSIYIPRFRDGKFIYDEDSWKVCVSTRSPSKGEAGQHIDTFPPRIKQLLLDYIHDKGFKLGKSEFKMESDKYELKEDEKWFGKAAGGEREVEIIIENGLSNDYKLRDELNIIYFLDLEKSMPAWPWAFKREVTAGNGFDLQ